MKPKIAITGGVWRDPDYFTCGYPRVIANQDYTRSVLEAGGLAYILPPTQDVSYIDELLQPFDGVIMAGGDDVDPLLYGEEPCTDSKVTPLRDRFEIAILANCFQNNIPIFGVCRGLQILNVYLGGTLYQDMSMLGETIAHKQKFNPEHPSHNVTIHPGSMLHEALGKERILVNSFHHQAIRDLGNGLKVSAVASDGVIEAVESTTAESFCMAVQWHPEMMSKNNVMSQKLFRFFLASCAKQRKLS